jgi:hypothetical protein
MPPRTRYTFVEGEGFNQPVSIHLTKEYYEMTTALNKTLECSICLEPICCKNCICLLLCGHSYHFNCILRVEKPAKCPLCRS